MQFRLTYQGPLFSDSHKNEAKRRARAVHKQDLRKAFHPQLRRLWETSKFLRTSRPMHDGFKSGHVTQREYLAERFRLNEYKFVPLVLEELGLVCAIHILFLRVGQPGDLIQVGDIDNRMKIVIDALRMPTDAKELGPYFAPEKEETPFYCLLEDDKLISHFAVETDTLLESLDGRTYSADDARLVVTVTVKPATNISLENLAFI